MATKEDRSLSAGMSLPRWMKTKISDRFEFDRPTFSPIEADDSFIYYYGKNSNDLTKTELTSTSTEAKRPDFSKHTPFCQKYLENGNESVRAQQVRIDNAAAPPPTAIKTKSPGTDDGFKGEAARCGTSIIRMAQQIVAGRMPKMTTTTSSMEAATPPEGFNPAIRRGSRSLPTSPLTSPSASPKNRRRVNKYFTGAFVDSDKQHGNWILSSLLSKRQTLSQSVDVITEEEPMRETKKSTSNSSIDAAGDGKKKSQSYRPKPSEYREMNFWSPTSM